MDSAPEPVSQRCAGVRAISLFQFSWPLFREQLEGLKNPSLEKALCLLPNLILKENAAVLVSSHSLLSASPDTPRVVLYPDVTEREPREYLFLTFGGSHPPLNQTLQVLRFQSQSKSTELIDIDFNQGLKIETGTPGRCQKCHGLEPRPLWSERDFWPAALAGESQLRTEKEFLKVKSQLSRAPFPAAISLGEFGNMRGRLKELNALFARINNPRLLKKVKSSPDYEFYKFAILGASLGCENIETFIPTGFQKLHQNTEFIAPRSPAQIADLVVHQMRVLAKTTKTAPPLAMQRMAARLDSVFGGFLKKQKRPSVDRILMSSSPIKVVRSSDDSVVRFAADMMRIESEKKLFGMRPEDNFPFYPIRDLTSVNLRYIFEGRGLEISDWPYDDLQGTYHFGLENLALASSSFVQLMVESDADLQLPQIKDLIEANQEDRSKILDEDFSRSPLMKSGLCQQISEKSIHRLNQLKVPTAFDQSKSKELALKNWESHFSKGAKLPQLALDLPTNPSSSRSCTQCHHGYEANFTGPEFTRKTETYPLAFMICANCHAEQSTRVAPLIPFNHQESFEKKWLSEPELKLKIEQRLSDGAKLNLNHMPPILKLSEPNQTAIRHYLRSL